MPIPKQKINWIVDAVLFLGFLATFFLDWTGLAWHQWLGAVLGALMLYHLLVHWKWVAAVTRRFLGKTSRQSRLYYLLDWTIALSLLVIGASGLWISSWLNLELADYLFWKDLHIYSSIGSLGLILVKIGVHWRWIVATARAHLGLWRSLAPVRAGSGAAAQPGSNTINRREFLQLMGAAGLVSLLSAANLVDFGQAAGESIVKSQTRLSGAPDSDPAGTAEGSAASCQPACDQGCTYPGQCRRYTDQNANGICDLTECQSGETSQMAISEHPADQPIDAETLDQPAAGLTASESTGDCVVACPRGCSYPGECRDYVDLNGNNLCDLGECLTANTAAAALVSDASGGGRRRRGNH